MKRILLLIAATVFCCIIATGAWADPPVNDDCTNAYDFGTLVSDSTVQYSGTVVDATVDCDQYFISGEVWVKFTLPITMHITIDYCDDSNTVPGTYRYLFSECPCNGRTYVSVRGNCSSNGNAEYLWYSVPAGTYYYPIDSDYMMAESYTINVTGEEVVTPDNDDCANAIAIGEVNNTEFTTIGASFDGEGTCTSAPNVWYVYTPTFTGEARITIDADYGQKFAVYDGAVCSPFSTELGCTWDDELYFEVVSSQQYLIEIGASNSSTTGSGYLTVEEAPERPANDDCENATDAGTLSAGVPVDLTGTVINATNDCDNMMEHQVWIKFTLANTMNVTIDFCNDWNTVMGSASSLYEACPCDNGGYYSYDESTNCLNYNPSRTWYFLEAGTYYYPVVEDYISSGSYTVTVTANEAVIPENNDCADASAIGEVTDLAYTTAGASYDGEGTCVSSSAGNVWYVYTPTFTGEAQIAVDAVYHKKFAVYDGAVCSPLSTEIDCTDDDELLFNVVSGQQYLIEIGGRYSGAFGDGTFSVGVAPAHPDNDDCVDATDAGTLSSGVPVTLNGTAAHATNDCGMLPSGEVWVKFTLATDMNVTIDFCNDWNSVMNSWSRLYEGCPCDIGEIYRNDESDLCLNNNPSKTWNELTAGTYYYPIIEEYHETESYSITITGIGFAAPENDSCVNAIAINEVDELSYTTVSSLFDGEGECFSSPNVWYVYTPTFTGEARITVDADYSQAYAVYDGAACSPLPTELVCTTDEQAVFDVVSGQQYLIEIGSSNGVTGTGLITIEEVPEPPANDDCVNADDAGTLTSGVTVNLTGTTIEATNDCELYSNKDVWIKFTIADCMNVTIDFCDDTGEVDFGSRYIYPICPCSDEGRIYISYDAYCENENPSMSWYELSAGTYYYPIYEDDIEEGTYSVNITGVDCPPDPDPDFSVTAPYTVSNTTCGAGNECYRVSSGEDHIYEVTIPMNGNWLFSLCNSTSDSWRSYLFLGTSICERDLGNDSYSCENGHAEFTVDDLSAGTYYLVITNNADTCGEYTLDIIRTGGVSFEYLPGDANMSVGAWPPSTIGGDVTYLVNYFRGITAPCMLDGFYASADANGDCSVTGADVTKLVSYFRGLAELSHCPNYPTTWPPIPDNAPDGWPNCASPVLSK